MHLLLTHIFSSFFKSSDAYYLGLCCSGTTPPRANLLLATTRQQRLHIVGLRVTCDADRWACLVTC